MPGTLTYAAIALLARDRLGQIERALKAKRDAGNANELEKQVLYLASQALEMMKDTQPVIDPPVRTYGSPLTDRVSRFLLLGAVGPELVRYGGPGQRWLYDTLHKGTPDEHRELVLTHSTELVFDFWEKIRPLLDAEYGSAEKRTAAKKKMKAYVLGHLCHVAADVLSHPYFEALESRLAQPTAAPPVRHMLRGDVASAIDRRVARDFFGRDAQLASGRFGDWYPDTLDLPDSFAAAMAESIRSLYGERPLGLPAFEETLAELEPTPISESLIEDSVESFRNIVAFERWTLAEWVGATAAFAVPFMAAYPAALALPLGKNLSRALTPEDGPDAEAQRTYEMVVFPLAMSCLAPLVSMILVSASGHGLGLAGVTGWIQAGVSVAATIAFFSSLGGAGPARWSLLFGVPLLFAVIQFGIALATAGREPARRLLWLGPAAQLGMWALFTGLYAGWLHEGVEEFDKPGEEREYDKALGYMFAWFAIVGAVWFGFAALGYWALNYTVPDDADALREGEPRAFLRLYDDVSLVHDKDTDLSSYALSGLLYPPGRRPLLKLWWPRPGPEPALRLQIDRARHDRLDFTWPGVPAAAGPGDLHCVVYAPAAPTTVQRFGELLAAAVTGMGQGTLHVLPVREDEQGLELAPGDVFADFGDDQTDLAAYEAVPIWQELPDNEAGALTLWHAPRPRLAQRMGRNGVVPDGRREEQLAVGDSVLNAAPAATPRRYSVTNPTGGGSPLLRRLLRPGDVLETIPAAGAGEQRIVESAPSDTEVVVSSPFIGAVAGLRYKRAPSDRTVRLPAAAQVQIPLQARGVGPNQVQAVLLPPPAPPPAAPPLGARLMVGDVVELMLPAPGAGPLARRVITAIDDGQPMDVRITALGDVGTAMFTVQIGGGPVRPALPTAASVLVPGTATTLYFALGNFAVNDHWTIAPDGTVTAAAGNAGQMGTSPRFAIAITAGGPVGTAPFYSHPCITESIRVVIDAGGEVGNSTFRYQIGAHPQSPVLHTAGSVPVENTLVTLEFSGGPFVAGNAWTIAPNGAVTPQAGNSPHCEVWPGPMSWATTGPSVSIAGTLTTAFFTAANYVASDRWVFDMNCVPTPAGWNTLIGGVTAAVSPRLLELDAPPPAFAGALALDRLSDLETHGYAYVADANQVFGAGDAVMDDAADLAALLCLGAASRLEPSADAAAPLSLSKPVHRVYQVFRNWNLDRRRLNEWKTIVSGGAQSERRADFAAAEEAAPVARVDASEAFSADFLQKRAAGEAIVREYGWLGVFRSWIDMASRARTDCGGTEVFRPGLPSNRELSLAMAYLIDSADGVVS